MDWVHFDIGPCLPFTELESLQNGFLVSFHWRRPAMTKKQRFCRKEKQMKKSEIFCFLENRAGDYGSRRAALSSKFMEMRPEVRYSAPKPLSSYSFVLEMRNTQKPANVWTWFRETLPNDDLPLYPDMESFLQIKLPASFYDFASSLKGSQKNFAICA